MVERRGGNFDLAGGCQLSILRDDGGADLPLFTAHQSLIGQRIAALFVDEGDDFGVFVEEFFIEPGDLGQHLEVPELLRPEDASGDTLLVLCFPRIVEFPVTGKAADHTVGVGEEEVAEDAGFVVVGEVFGRLEGEVQQGIVGLTTGVFLDLDHHGRDQVKGLPDGRKFFQDFDHAVVVLQGMHAGPREAILTGGEVLIERLVHVPEKAQVDFWHGQDSLQS